MVLLRLFSGDTSANIGRVLADIVLGNKNCPERGKSCEPDSVSDFKGFLDKYSVLQFKEDTIKHDKTSGGFYAIENEIL